MANEIKTIAPSDNQIVRHLYGAKSKYQPNETLSLEVNLDAIISVGYRVNSVNATAFRRWATNVLRDHLLHGYTINRQLVALQERVDNRFTALEQRLDKHDEQIA